ncbi:uncharacterized protein LOC134176997 isoform X2 [Corticium candelabrum]|uniref:uncharacterized protein LOC134176997 isoform X2 n=1 Tax=Corticium candelabrum TaxID=121492 RepID=UPI002E252854|nr:uncharacterized protein LOC134176997 isoform X2 [Corticium candelabrum]
MFSTTTGDNGRDFKTSLLSDTMTKEMQSLAKVAPSPTPTVLRMEIRHGDTKPLSETETTMLAPTTTKFYDKRVLKSNLLDGITEAKLSKQLPIYVSGKDSINITCGTLCPTVTEKTAYINRAQRRSMSVRIIRKRQAERLPESRSKLATEVQISELVSTATNYKPRSLTTQATPTATVGQSVATALSPSDYSLHESVNPTKVSSTMRSVPISDVFTTSDYQTVSTTTGTAATSVLSTNLNVTILCLIITLPLLLTGTVLLVICCIWKRIGNEVKKAINLKATRCPPDSKPKDFDNVSLNSVVQAPIDETNTHTTSSHNRQVNKTEIKLRDLLQVKVEAPPRGSHSTFPERTQSTSDIAECSNCNLDVSATYSLRETMMQTRPTAAGRTRESDNQRASVDLTCDSRPYSFENLYIEDELKQKLDALKTSKHDKPIDSVTKSSPADNVLSNECGQTEKGGTECYHEGQLSSKVTVKDSNNLSYLTGSPECDGSSPVLQTMTASTPKLMDEGIQVPRLDEDDRNDQQDRQSSTDVEQIDIEMDNEQ